jgi:hypothetical protein
MQVRADARGCADGSDRIPAQPALAARKVAAARNPSERTGVRLDDITKVPARIARRVPGTKAGLMVVFPDLCCLPFRQVLLAWAPAGA